MKISNFVSVFTVALLLIVSSCKSTSKKEALKETSTTPNIVYILADDLGYGDVSYLGQKKFKTPNIDQLAKQGMVFTQHYSGSTVCAPSRSTLMTGQHTGNTPIRGNQEVRPEGQLPMPAESYTVAELLKEHGYTTGVFGKWGLGFPASTGDANNQGFDEFYGYNCQRLAHSYYPYHLWHNQKKIILEGNKGFQHNQYAPYLIHDEAIKFMEINKDKPFFMYYASALPHAELLLPQENIDEFKGKFLPEKSYKGKDRGEKYKAGGYRSQENGHAAYAAMITLLDKQVGEIVLKLEELGISDNTIVVFTSDNGPHKAGGADPLYFNSNGSFRGIKQDLYEGGIRVPMITKWPGKIKEGSSTNHISAFWDFMPTVAEIIGVDKPKNIDGISYLPSLLNKDTQEKHEYLYWEYNYKGGRIAVRKDNWKAVKYNALKNVNRKIELYNLESDPSETTNIANEFPEVVAELAQIMREARTPSEAYKFDFKILEN
ncbi:MAG: sulfatase-like hydrolase/transferase [Lutibacter sp.]|uniref:arylsulfatase n=1 Tax=Lutibacter sp. TaxID=1925666 RepID=UPI0019DC2987|nr:arylsulfatase [Lutibacter sp.]NOR27956.1 sulfatase-like hydrolase/transferase [Lutibacter sp.]